MTEKAGTGTITTMEAKTWMLDELAHAGPEHLDPGFVAGFDRKQGYPDFSADVSVLAAPQPGSTSWPPTSTGRSTAPTPALSADISPGTGPARITTGRTVITTSPATISSAGPAR
ncbi:MAG: hypothetical protein ACRDOI_37395 [Trebonia sp.]